MTWKSEGGENCTIFPSSDQPNHGLHLLNQTEMETWHEGEAHEEHDLWRTTCPNFTPWNLDLILFFNYHFNPNEILFFAKRHHQPMLVVNLKRCAPRVAPFPRLLIANSGLRPPSWSFRAPRHLISPRWSLCRISRPGLCHWTTRNMPENTYCWRYTRRTFWMCANRKS